MIIKQVHLKKKNMQFVVTCLGSVLRWTYHRTFCAFLHEHQPRDKTPLPQHSDHLPLLEVLEHTQVEKNVFRRVVYVLWLAKHPRSYHWHRKIEKERLHLVPSMFTLLFWCGVSWLRERRKRCMSRKSGSRNTMTFIPKPV